MRLTINFIVDSTYYIIRQIIISFYLFQVKITEDRVVACVSFYY